MRKRNGVLMRQLFAAIALSGLAIATMMSAAGAADLLPVPQEQVAAHGLMCPPREPHVVLFDEDGVPTVPGRTPYYTCVTGTVLLPGDIPPPPEYCCS